MDQSLAAGGGRLLVTRRAGSAAHPHTRVRKGSVAGFEPSTGACSSLCYGAKLHVGRWAEGWTVFTW